VVSGGQHGSVVRARCVSPLKEKTKKKKKKKNKEIKHRYIKKPSQNNKNKEYLQQ